MAIPLRVIQQFYDEEDGTRVWTNYRLEVRTAEGWVEVPVVVQEVAQPEKKGVDIRVGGQYGMKC
jgi:hypothetical protein